MTQEFIDNLIKLGVDVENSLDRFCDNESLYEKNLFRFIDEKSYPNLLVAVKNNDSEVAIREVHSLKGVSGNLGFKALYEAAAKMVIELRKNMSVDMEPLFSEVTKAYDEIVSFLKKSKEEKL